MSTAAVKCEHVWAYRRGTGLSYTQIARGSAEIHYCRNRLRRLFAFKIGTVISVKRPATIQGAIAIFVS